MSIGHTELFLPETGSTNDDLQHLYAQSDVQEGFVLHTGYQHAGRGQMGSHWTAARDQNILLSVLLRPTWLPIAAQFWLNIAASVALHDTVQALLPTRSDVRIKWPNDLYIGTKKCAGMLIQNNLQGGKISHSIVGIGLNVNQLDFESLPGACSIALLAGHTFDLVQLRQQLYRELNERYAQLHTGDKSALRAAYCERLLGMHETRMFEERASGTVLMGKILGVSEDGQLELLTDAGLRRVQLKELNFCL